MFGTHQRRQFHSRIENTLAGFLIVGLVIIGLSVFSFGRAGATPASPAYAGPEGPGNISIHASDVPFAEAYAMLSKASGVKIRDTGFNPLDRISFNVIDEPFWIALQRLNQKSKMRVGKVVQDEGPEVTLYAPALVSNHLTVGTAIDGLFLATLVDITVERHEAKKINPTQVLASQLEFSVQPDPRLKAMLLQSMHIDELIDESGRPIATSAPFRTSAFNDGSAGTTLTLARRPGPRRIGRMKISAKAMVATRWETVDVANLTAGGVSTTNVAGFRIVTQTRPAGSGSHINIEFTRTGSASSAPIWLREPARIILLKPQTFDRAGHRLDMGIIDTDWFGKMFRVELEAYATPDNRILADVDRVRVEIPTDVTFYDMHFEFSNVTLN